MHARTNTHTLAPKATRTAHPHSTRPTCSSAPIPSRNPLKKSFVAAYIILVLMALLSGALGGRFGGGRSLVRKHRPRTRTHARAHEANAQRVRARPGRERHLPGSSAAAAQTGRRRHPNDDAKAAATTHQLTNTILLKPPLSGDTYS
jgi:hypothetical protein